MKHLFRFSPFTGTGTGTGTGVSLAATGLALALSVGAVLSASSLAFDGSGGTGSPFPHGGGPPPPTPHGGGGPNGGSYGGPKDGVPSGPGPSTGGGSGGPGTPAPGPGPAGPRTPAAPGPNTPNGPPSAPGSPKTPGRTGEASIDLSQWKYWWYYNSKPYLNLKRTIYVPPTVTGSDEFYLGRGTESKLRPSSDRVRKEMVPALLELLSRAESKEIVDAAMISLAKLGDDPASDGESEIRAALQPLLAYPNQFVAETAAISLGILGRDDSALALAHVLENDEQGRALRRATDVEERTRAYAGYALGLIGGRSSREDARRYVVSRLCATFERGGSASTDVPIACLLSLGLVPLPSDPAWTAGGEKLIPSRCREAQIEWALRVYTDSRQPSWVRAHAPTTIARLSKDLPRDAPARTQAVERFLQDLRPNSPAEREVQQSCVLALGQLGFADSNDLDRSIRKAMMGLTHVVGDQQARMFALIALGQIGGRPGKDPLAAIEDIRTYLLRELVDGRTTSRPWAAIAIAVLERALDDAQPQLVPSSPEMKLALRKVLADSSQPDLVGALCTAIGIVRDREGAAEIRNALETTQDTEAKGHAMVALGLIGARSSLDAIEKILLQSKFRPELVQRAATGLGLMRDAQLVPKLIELMNDNASVSSLGAVCFALGRVGDVRGVDALLALARSAERNNIARGLATEALGAVADKDFLPWNTALSCNSNYCAHPGTLSDPQYPGILDMD
jgi:HEAT repeat protein